MTTYPRLLHTVLDATDARELAEFWRALLGLEYGEGSEPPAPGEPEDEDWLVLTRPDGTRCLAIQQTEVLHRATWPDADVPMQLHLDLTVGSVAELEAHRERVLGLGATQLLDRTDDPDEPLYVFADPAGHPFCLFVG